MILKIDTTKGSLSVLWCDEMCDSGIKHVISIAPWRCGVRY